MINEVIHKLCEDKKGNIWCATDNGVFCYVPKEDRFTNYSVKSLGLSGTCFNILCDRQGTVWASGRWSLFKFNEGKNVFEEVIKITERTDSLNSYRIVKNGMREDPSAKGLWMTTSSGIVYYDISKQVLLTSKNTGGNPLFRRRSTSALGNSTQGNAWFFDDDRKEIVLFSTTRQTELRKINITNNMPGAFGGTLYEDSNQRLWFSSWSYELLVIDLKSDNKVYKIQHQDDDKRSVAGLFFWDVYEDADKNIWLGTVAGISKCNPERIIYRKYQLPNIIPEIKNTAIKMAEKNPADGTTWIITGSSLLIQYNPVDHQYKIFDFKDAAPGREGARPGYINGIRFFNGSPIVTTRSGLWRVAKNASRMTPFHYLPKGFEDFKCIDMAIKGDSVIYYTNGKDILYWNYVSGNSELISYKGEIKPALRITNFVLTQQQQLWMIGAGNHLLQLTHDKKMIVHDIISDTVKETGSFQSLDQDSKGNIWVLNKGTGIYCYNPGTKSVKLWNETDGLIGNRVHKMAVDSAGRIWNMLFNKVSVYTPETGRFYNFKVPYNESNLNYYNHITRMPNGNMLSNINNELIEFYPERLLGIPSKVKPQISQLTVSGKSIPVFDETNISFKPNQNTIRIQFGTLINKDIFPYDVEYKLEGGRKRLDCCRRKA